MYYSATSIALVAFAATVQAHGVILQAVGEQGASQGFLGEYFEEQMANCLLT